MLIQRDTYFKVPRGRLKLREEPGAAAQLIAYERPDLTGPKVSGYRLVELSNPDELREALAATLGISVVVSKARRLFLLDGVRIHLDHLERLGDFIEFEGVAAEGDDPAEFANTLAALCRSFDISDDDFLSQSYADLLLAAEGRSSPPEPAAHTDGSHANQACRSIE